MSKTLIKEGVIPEKKPYQFTCDKCGCVWTDDEAKSTFFVGHVSSTCMTCGVAVLVAIPLSASESTQCCSGCVY